MKLEYIEPEIEITLFSIEDIICDSGIATEEPEETGIEIDATNTAPVFSYNNFL